MDALCLSVFKFQLAFLCPLQTPLSCFPGPGVGEQPHGPTSLPSFQVAFFHCSFETSNKQTKKRCNIHQGYKITLGKFPSPCSRLGEHHLGAKHQSDVSDHENQQLWGVNAPIVPSWMHSWMPCSPARLLKGILQKPQRSQCPWQGETQSTLVKIKSKRGTNKNKDG